MQRVKANLVCFSSSAVADDSADYEKKRSSDVASLQKKEDPKKEQKGRGEMAREQSAGLGARYFQLGMRPGALL